MIDANHTEVVLWGTLRRKAPDTWEWIDGTSEPAVRDMLAESAYNFRRRHYTDKKFVEVPEYAVHGDSNLGWVQKYHTRKGLDGGRISRALEKGKAGLRFQDTSEVYLVPVMVWNRWAKNKVVGAEWDIDQQKRILQKAHQLKESHAGECN